MLILTTKFGLFSSKARVPSDKVVPFVLKDSSASYFISFKKSLIKGFIKGSPPPKLAETQFLRISFISVLLS